jgi:hypothetical protein
MRNAAAKTPMSTHKLDHAAIGYFERPCGYHSVLLWAAYIPVRRRQSGHMWEASPLKVGIALATKELLILGIGVLISN